jgi:hypothetical protein
MELTWIAVLASLLMAAAAACVFVFAVKKDYFRNIEDAKYQVFWSDLEDGPRPKAGLPPVALPLVAAQEKHHESGSPT